MNDEILEVVSQKPDSLSSTDSATVPAKLDGVVIGVLLDLRDTGTPVIAFPGNPESTGVAARCTTPLSHDDIGREVALLFENGDPLCPVVIGCIQHRSGTNVKPLQEQQLAADIDGERIMLTAKKEIVLRCGKASITLTKAGKILIRGAYLLNRSSGMNRIKGGSVQIN